MAKSGNERPGGLTPIKKSMKFQKEKSQRYDNKPSRLDKYDVTLNGRALQIEHDPLSDDVLIDGKLYRTSITDEDGYYVAKVNDNHLYRLEFHDGQIFIEGRIIEFDFKKAVPKLIRKKTTKGDEELIVAPLPGNIVGLSVAKGDFVKKGDKILTLEAMKMQNDILCEIGGVVTDVYVVLGDLVSKDDRLVYIGPESKP